VSETPIRSIRVDDITWLHAQHVADFYDTSVTAMVVEFLQALRIGQKPTRAVVKTVNKVAPVPRMTRRPGMNPGKLPAAFTRPEAERVKVDPATCTHEIKKELPYGEFCMACGARTKEKAQ